MVGNDPELKFASNCQIRTIFCLQPMEALISLSLRSMYFLQIKRSVDLKRALNALLSVVLLLSVTVFKDLAHLLEHKDHIQVHCEFEGGDPAHFHDVDHLAECMFCQYKYVPFDKLAKNEIGVNLIPIHASDPFLLVQNPIERKFELPTLRAPPIL